MLIGRLGSQAGALWFLESAICFLVGETGPGAGPAPWRAGLEARGFSDCGCWWLELSAGPSVDRAMSRGDRGCGGLKAACLLMGVLCLHPGGFLA